MPKNSKSGLGRGLDAIFLDNSSADSDDNITVLRLSEIEPNPEQPRREFDREALQQLADSIAANGLIQPIIVRSGKNEGYYEIIAGERRWRAAQMAGLTEVPVVVMEISDVKAAQVSLIENIQRESLNAIEEANAFKKLITEYAMTQDELSRQIGKSRSLIANTIRLLDLPEPIERMVIAGDISAGHARTLLPLKDEELMVKAAQITKTRDLSVRSLEALVRNMLKKPAKEQKPEEAPAQETESRAPEIDYTAELAKKMTEALGQRVTIHNTGKNKKIEIEYSSDEELDGLVKKLCGDDIFDR